MVESILIMPFIDARGMWLVLFFFFSSRRRHTRLQGDWSSDVCSSDHIAAFSDDGEWIVTTSFDAFASLWEVDSGRELARFSGGFVGFRQAAISPDKTRVVLYKYEGELSVWDPANEQPMATLPIEAGAWPFAASIG